jgi:hypothetical protein
MSEAVGTHHGPMVAVLGIGLCVALGLLAVWGGSKVLFTAATASPATASQDLRRWGGWALLWLLSLLGLIWAMGVVSG